MRERSTIERLETTVIYSHEELPTKCSHELIKRVDLYVCCVIA
jgi:hypothetical protein